MMRYDLLTARITAIVLFALAAVCVSAQPQPDMQRGGFELTVSQEFDDTGRTILVVNTAVPYRRLVFLRRGERYESSYRVYMELLDARDEAARGDVWEESVAVATYEETKSSSTVSATRKSFPVEPGSYTVDVTIEVINTSLRFKREREIKIVGRGEGNLELAEPVFTIAKITAEDGGPEVGEVVLTSCGSAEGGGPRMIPGATFAEFNGWLRIMYNLVSPPPETPADRYILSVKVQDAQKRAVLYNRTHVRTRESGLLTFCLEINVDEFSMGDYVVSTVVERPGSDERTAAEGTFTVLLNRSIFGKHFGEAVEILSLFAEEEELEELRTAEGAARVDAWNRFWRKRDPTPSTEGNEELEQFLARVNYVLKNFSKYRDGWRTDRGKIYIKYGEPDKVINTDGTTLGSRVQYWIYYSRNIAYVFEDASGMGEYQLITTQMI
jgi:GWxTD domain-containing protein